MRPSVCAGCTQPFCTASQRIAWRPISSKVSRAERVSPLFEAGNVLLPEDVAGWLEHHVPEGSPVGVHVQGTWGRGTGDVDGLALARSAAADLEDGAGGGDRAARQAILSGREWTAGDPDAALLCDEVVEAGEMDRALSARIEALTNSGLVNATANRRTLRAGLEPLGLFREYMATYAREQARCHLSPALVRNLEVHWRARGRSL